jgi:hypothetical protein
VAHLAAATRHDAHHVTRITRKAACYLRVSMQLDKNQREHFHRR